LRISKDTQKKFQQEREEYYERTMKAARATQWTPRSRDNDKSSAGHFKDGAKDRGVEPKAITELATNGDGKVFAPAEFKDLLLA